MHESLELASDPKPVQKNSKGKKALPALAVVGGGGDVLRKNDKNPLIMFDEKTPQTPL